MGDLLASTGNSIGPAGAAEPYQGLARFYDAVLGKNAHRAARRRFEWLLSRFDIRFASAADAACGTGLFLRHLGRWTRCRTGVDRSPAMLRQARRRNPSPEVRLLCQDLRAMRLPDPVDLITCNFDALNYLLTPSDLRAALVGFRRNLNPRGHLIFDIVIRLSQEGPRLRLLRGPGYFCRWLTRNDRRRNLRRAVLDMLLLKPDGSWRRRKEVHLQRPLEIGDTLALLRGQGLRPRGVFDASTLGPPDSKTRRALLLAERETPWTKTA